jgi:hypothetical protein
LSSGSTSAKTSSTPSHAESVGDVAGVAGDHDDPHRERVQLDDRGAGLGWIRS